MFTWMYEYECYDYKNKYMTKDNDNIFTFTFDVPGKSKDDVEVFFENSVLTIKFDEREKKFMISKEFEIESAKVEKGQLIIKFKEIENKKCCKVELS